MKTSWDLTPLFSSDNDPKIAAVRESSEKEVVKFTNKWKGRNDYLKNPGVLKEALDDYEKWLRLYGANSSEDYYFGLRTHQDQNNTDLKAKYNKSSEFTKYLQNEIQFFELNLAKIPEALQKKFLDFMPLSPYRHFLEKLFNLSKHLLSDREEKIMNLKAEPANNNWVKMTGGFITKEERKILTEKGKTETKDFSSIASLINSPDKKVRDSAAFALNDILETHVEVAVHELNSVLQNKKIDDELRDYKRPDSARHLSDDVETEVVDTLTKTVTANFDTAKRYYKLKAKLMKVPKLTYHERNVDWGKIDKKYSYKDGVEIIDKVFGNLDGEFSKIFMGFVDEGRVDVYPAKGKYAGAFCDYSLISLPTYSLLNWTERLNDVLTFAHEMGHGINFELIRKSQNSLNFGTTVATTEVASTFMEDFVLQELLKNADEEMKLSLMMMKLNDDISTIFRQVACYNLETELHSNFRKIGYLSKDKISEIFRKNMTAYMGPAVEQSKGSENWWVFWNHIRYFFYVYSYASGLLISKSLQASVKKDRNFILKVKEFLSAGLSDSPKNIFAKLGIDITDEKFWEEGIAEVNNLLKETEGLAVKLGKI